MLPARLLRISLLASIALVAAHADTAVDFTAPSPCGFCFGALGDFNLGWQFSTTQSIQVTGLGFYNVGSEQHAVGIYQLGNFSPLVTAVVSSADPASGNWNFESLLTPLTLAPGTYRIVGQSKSSVFAWVVDGLVVDPRIQLQDGYFTGGGALAYPTTQTTWVGYFGPNFQLAPAAPPPPPAVPEPSSMLLLGTALGALGIAARHRRR